MRGDRLYSSCRDSFLLSSSCFPLQPFSSCRWHVTEVTGWRRQMSLRPSPVLCCPRPCCTFCPDKDTAGRCIDKFPGAALSTPRRLPGPYLQVPGCSLVVLAPSHSPSLTGMPCPEPLTPYRYHKDPTSPEQGRNSAGPKPSGSATWCYLRADRLSHMGKLIIFFIFSLSICESAGL